MGKTKEIILCQPDDGKGCSVCCGLFNFIDIPKEELDIFLKEGRNRLEDDHEEYISFSEDDPFRDIGSHICPYQGFLNDNKPGCLLHPACNGKDLRDKSLFTKKICDKFFCPAHVILDEKQKKILIEGVGDWYNYAIAIIDPESFIWILDKAEDAASGNERLRNKLLSVGLEIHGRFLGKAYGPLFFYSLPEYKMGNKQFSLAFDTEERKKEKKEILAAIEALSVQET